jgi:type I restriction enzyme R subunit
LIYRHGEYFILTNDITSNFAFLKEHDPIFFQLAVNAEQAFTADPNTTLIKLRQLGEAFAQEVAARCGIKFNETTSQLDLLYKIHGEIGFEPQIKELFYTLRVEGNRATHQFKTKHKEAMDGLKIARNLAIWFHRAFAKNTSNFKPGSFTAPSDPSAHLSGLQNQIPTSIHLGLLNTSSSCASSFLTTKLVIC